MSAPSLDIDALSLGPNKCIIVGPTLNLTVGPPAPGSPSTPYVPGQITSVGVTAILTSELQIGVDANYGPIFSPDVFNNVDQIVNQVTAAMGSLDQTFFSKMRGQLATRNVLQSAQVWRGTEQPTFTLNLLLLALSSDDDIISQVQMLYSMVLPQDSVDAGSSNLNSAGTVIAPLGYFPDLQTTAYLNTVGFQLGDGEYAWFQAMNLIAKNVSFTFSQEIATNGSPLYAVGQVVLQPARMITFTDFKQYFVKPGQAGVSG